jgi:hypothetical protein
MEYLPLDESLSEIRVIDLHPSTFESELRCSMRHVSLDKAQYAALSYAWGNRTKKGTMTVVYEKGHICRTIEIGGNLAAALKYIRRDDVTLTIWVRSALHRQLSILLQTKGEFPSIRLSLTVERAGILNRPSCSYLIRRR